jgi:hypothetical protein
LGIFPYQLTGVVDIYAPNIPHFGNEIMIQNLNLKIRRSQLARSFRDIDSRSAGANASQIVDCEHDDPER